MGRADTEAEQLERVFRKLKVTGPKSKAMGLEPLLHACEAVYPDIQADDLG